MFDAVEQVKRRLKRVAVTRVAAGGPQDGLVSDGERGVEMRAAGGEEVAAGVGERFLEDGKLAPVSYRAGADAGQEGGSAGRIAGDDGNHGGALRACETVERQSVRHGL